MVEITPPLNPDGSYYMTGGVYGPDAPIWQYIADPPEHFYGLNISSAQRLPDGNTLICSGPNGKMFEVTSRRRDGLGISEPTSQPRLGIIFRAIRYPADYPGLANLAP